jgi:hypothetical protein
MQDDYNMNLTHGATGDHATHRILLGRNDEDAMLTVGSLPLAVSSISYVYVLWENLPIILRRHILFGHWSALHSCIDSVTDFFCILESEDCLRG